MIIRGFFFSCFSEMERPTASVDCGLVLLLLGFFPDGSERDNESDNDNPLGLDFRFGLVEVSLSPFFVGDIFLANASFSSSASLSDINEEFDDDNDFVAFFRGILVGVISFISLSEPFSTLLLSLLLSSLLTLPPRPLMLPAFIRIC